MISFSSVFKQLKSLSIAVCYVFVLAILTPDLTSAQDIYLQVQLNAGGDAVDGWGIDSEASPSPYLLAGSANVETINGTPVMDASVPTGTPLSLFETKRIDADQAEPFMTWTFPEIFPYPSIDVHLYFIEMSRCSVGSRLFDIKIGNIVVAEDFDVYAEAGNQCNVGIMRSFTVNPQGTPLTIEFPLGNGKPSIVSGIEIFAPPPYEEPPISLIVGNPEHSPYHIGDGEDATKAGLNYPQNTVFDSDGNLFINDAGNYRIRKVDAVTNIITSHLTYEDLDLNPDEYMTASASLSIALDADENLYIGTTKFYSQSYILKQDRTTGLLSIIAGQEDIGYSGDGGPAVEAQISYAQGLYIDEGDNIFFADKDNHVIRKIDAISGIIETVAGNGSEGFSGDGGLATDAMLSLPKSIVMDTAGNLFFTDEGNNRVRKVDVTTGIITTIAGTGLVASTGDGGPAELANLHSPRGLAFDSFGNLFVSDYGGLKVRKIDALTNVITTLVESPYLIGAPESLEFHQDKLYILVQGSSGAVYEYDFGSSSNSASLSATPFSIDFGKAVAGGASDIVDITLTNEGQSQIAITDIYLAGNNPGDFSFTMGPSSTINGESFITLETSFTPTQSVAGIPMFASGDPVYRINAGGSIQTDPSVDWAEDTDFSPSQYLAAGTANIEIDSETPTLDSSVPVGTPVDLFTSMRIDANKADPVMAWDFPVTPNEEYEIQLYFVEMSRCSVSSRVFDVEIEGALVFDNLDVFNEAGSCNVGIMRSFTAISTDETLSISFPLENGKPATIAAIEILGADAITPILKDAQIIIEHTGANPALSINLSGEVDQIPGDNIAPEASFTYESSYLTASFTDASSDSDGLVASWVWDFGDGNTSTQQNPLHTYAVDGTYSVTLTVTDNSAGQHSFSADVLVTPDIISLSLPIVEAEVNTSGIIPVMVTDVTGRNVLAYAYTISYDPTVIDITDVNFNGAIVSTYPVSINVDTSVPGEVSVSWGYAFPFNGVGLFANLEVDYLATGSTALTFTEVEFNEESTIDVAVNGSVNVVPAIPSEVTLSLPSVVGDVNTTDIIPLSISDVTGKDIISYTYKIDYDATVIDITGVNFVDTIVSDTPPTIINTTEPGQIIVSWTSLTAITGEGVFANLKVDYLAAGVSPLTLSTALFNEGIPGSIVVDGDVTVSGGSGAFLEIDGMVVMEAENAQENNPGVEHEWQESTDLAGYSGDFFMATTPDSRTTYNKEELDQSPELKFDIEFSTPGSYAVWARFSAPNKKGDTIHMGFDDEPHLVQSVISTGLYDQWVWGHLFENPDIQTFEVTESGTHTVHVWMREDGVRVDKVLLALDHSFVPSDEGPSESPMLGQQITSRSSFGQDALQMADQQVEPPTEYSLAGNFPNPFNPTTTIQYALPEAASVSLIVYDMMGRKVATLVDGQLSAGRYEAQWNAQTDAGTNVASGIYLYRLKAGAFESVKRMVLMK